MKHSTTKQLTLCALFAALTAVLSQIQLPIGPIPFNLAVFGAYLAGMLLTPIWAACSMCVYLAIGLIGAPVFAGFQGGPAVLFGKTGGYIIGYIAIALCTAIAMKYACKFWAIIPAMIFGLLLCYTLGTAWFMTITGADFISSLGWCVIPFVVPDLGKAACAYALGMLLTKRLKKAQLL